MDKGYREERVRRGFERRKGEIGIVGGAMIRATESPFDQ